MPPTVVIFKVVYLRLLASVGYNCSLNPDMLKLAAKFGSNVFSVWVKPSKSINKYSLLGQNGLKANKNGELFLNDKRLPTVDLKTALTRFHEFITSSPEPVLLITHSSGIELTILFEAIRKTMMVDVFKGVIQRVVDTVPIFEKRFPNLKKGRGRELALDDLMSYMTKGKRSSALRVLETSHLLRCLEQLVTENHVSASELIEISESYEKLVQNPSAPLFHNPQTISDLSPILSNYTRHKLYRAKILFDTLKELSQEKDAIMLYRYVNTQCVENGTGQVPFDTILEIFNFLKKPRPRDHGARSVNTGQERSAVEPGPSTSHGKQYNDYSLLGQQKELVDDSDSIMEEPGASYDRNNSCVRQETRTHLPFMRPSVIKKIGNPRVEYGEGYDNDYAFSPGQQELIPAMGLYSEEQERANYPIEPVIDRNSFVEEQEIPWNLSIRRS